MRCPELPEARGTNLRKRSHIEHASLAAVLAVAAVLGTEEFSTGRAVAVVAAVAGLSLVHVRLRAEFSRGAAVLATLVLFGATSLFWSVTRSASAFDSIAFAVLAAVTFGATLPRASRDRIAAWAGVGAAAILTRALSARFSEPSDGSISSLSEALFLPSGGFFALTPVAYVAALGLVGYATRFATPAFASLAILIAWAVSVHVWPANVSEPFGHGLTPTLALLAPGLAQVIDFARRRPLLAIAPLVLAAAAWNYWLMVQYTAGTLPKDAPVSFGTMVRQQADVHTRSPYLYPFAFPANAWFSWREGVPADRYELLSREPFLTSLDLVFDQQAARFLLEGWGGAGTTFAGPLRWTAARRSQLVVPLQPAATGMLITVTAAARGEEPPVAVRVGVQMNGVEIGEFMATPTSADARILLPAGSIGRILRAGYNRVTIVQHGIQRVDPNDTRPLGPMGSRGATVPFPVAIYRIRINPAS